VVRKEYSVLKEDMKLHECGWSKPLALEGKEVQTAKASYLRAPPPERSPDVRAAARKAAARPHLSPYLLPPPSRLSRMVFLIHGAGDRPRPASSGSALGVAESAPWGPDLPPGASACRRAPLAAAAGPGSKFWLAAVREPGGGSRGWPDPPSWSCGVCLASSRGARSARRTSRGGRPDPRRPFSHKSVVS
jgi:hypothetical protein